MTAGKAAAAVAPDRYWNPALGDVGPDRGLGTSIADRSQLPEVAGLKALDFPAIERAKLKNGIEVVFAKRSAVPTVNVAVSFDAGYAGGFALGVLGEESGSYRDAFAESYQRGWDESVIAAQEAAHAIPLPDDATEFRVLSRMPDGASAVERLASAPDP